MEDSEESTMLGPVGGNFYFKRLPDGNLDKTVVLCKLCKKEFAYHRSTSTLRYHLNAKHAASTGTVGAVSNSASSPSSSTNKRCRQPNLDEMTGFRTKISKSTSDKLTNSLAKWLALDCRPLSVVEDKGLENVLQLASGDPTFQLPCRKTISHQIQQLYDTEKQAKFDALQKADFVALTGDHWTSVSNSNYIGVTAHIVDDVTDGTWNLQSFVLTVQKTNTRNYAENCAEQFLSVAGEWGIQQKITTIGTDGARSMVVAARHLPFQHMPCAAHVLQRTITVSLADSEFSDALAKCRKIVGHFKHSPANTEELHQEQTRLGQEKEPLIQDVSTRWNSTLDMVSRLLKNQEAVFAALDKQKHKLVILTPSELVKLQKLATVLEPCRFVTELLGGETYVSCSVVLPAFCHLHHTMEVSDDDSNYMVKFKTAFTKDLSQRGATLNHQWLKIATVLDPRFKDLKCLARGEREEVWTSLEALLQEQCKDATTKEPAKTKRLLLSSLSSDSDSDEEVMCNRALNMYRAEATISETDCPLQWWSSRAATHPQLSVLARKYLISPATSVPCERLFSLAGHIVTKKRAALSSENVNRQVCLSNWLKETDNK